MPAFPTSTPVRIGIIKTIGRTYIEFEFIDTIDNQTFRVPCPQPYAGRGGGILAGIEKDTLVLVARGPGEKWYCVSTIPDHNFFFDLDSASNILEHETTYPKLKEGEVCIKSNKGSRVDLLDNGNIRLDAGIGLSISDIELSKQSEALFVRVDNNYSFTESGRKIDGVIRRDKSFEEKSIDTDTINFLDSETYDRLLRTIGRSSGDEVQIRTSKTLGKQVLRNPPLVERREIIYEYANSADLRNLEDEKIRHNEIEEDTLVAKSNISYRPNRRTDVLNLNLRNYNHLIEKVEGTVVDRYGNVLDINRNIINVPSASTIKSDGNDDGNLKSIYDFHRRGIKFHYEINSRKDIDAAEPEESDKSKNNAKNFSRWSVDVDGEGLTKINIPASSETGNIPILSRYFTSRDEEGEKDSGSFKDQITEENPVRKDIRIKQFGASKKDDKENFSGASISNSDYIPDTIDDLTVTVGTAYHDILSIADSIISDPIITTLTNKISSPDDESSSSDPNAGGRSMHINLDGSMEMSIGADTVDKKSLVLDTQGGVLAHFGRDKNGRSIIQQTDGDVLIQIGGTAPDGDDRFTDTEEKSGKLIIHVNRLGGSATPQTIIIDENGITIDVVGKMDFTARDDITITSTSGNLNLNGQQVLLYDKSTLLPQTGSANL